MINALDYGFVPNDEDFDNTVKLDDFVSTESEVTLYLPTGVYYFNTVPQAIDRNVRLIGEGINNTTLNRNYNETSLNNALINTVNTITVKDMAIHANTGTRGGGAIKLDGLGASGSQLDTLYITGKPTGTWEIPLTIRSADPLGIRSCWVSNVTLFAATVHLAWLINVKGLDFNGSAYPAGGTSNRIVIQDSGAIRSGPIQFKTYYLEQLWVYNTDGLTFIGMGNTGVNQSGCAGIRIF